MGRGGLGCREWRASLGEVGRRRSDEDRLTRLGPASTSMSGSWDVGLEGMKGPLCIRGWEKVLEGVEGCLVSDRGSWLSAI